MDENKEQPPVSRRKVRNFKLPKKTVEKESALELTHHGPNIIHTYEVID